MSLAPAATMAWEILADSRLRAVRMGGGAVLIGGAPSSWSARGWEDGAEEKKDGDGGPHREQVCRRLFLLVDTQAIYSNRVSLNSLFGNTDI